MPPYSTDADTLVVSWHKGVLEQLAAYPYEAAALLWLALQQAEVRRPGGPTMNNFGLALMLTPLGFLSRDEILEAVERLTVRGFLERAGQDSVSIDPVATSAPRLAHPQHAHPGHHRAQSRGLNTRLAAQAVTPTPGPTLTARAPHSFSTAHDPDH
ncbi:hypothetical protein [Streptomyces bobili]|uniref:hypothetical protein n=1 Tax=Streptomyces bobili TaxID=67280 RepID=UPI0037234AB2